MNATPQVRIVVVDDQQVVRDGFASLLKTQPDFTVVGTASEGKEGVRICRERQPDVVVMDVRMPRSTGIEAARRIRERLPDTKVIMLTVSDSEEDLYAAVKAGASGYLLKEISIEELADAVRAVARGHSLISPSMASKLLTEFNALVQQAEERHRSLLPSLTDRELDVLKLVAKGLSNREISEELYISENTVKNHVRNILEKLHLHSRMEAVVYAMREKLLDVD